MKGLFLCVVPLLIIAGTGCGKKDNATGNPADIANQLMASSWGIHYFYSNTDQTNLFSGYVFAFKEDSILTATHTTTSYNGKWHVEKQTDGSVKLSFTFTSPGIVQSLNNNWKIISNNGTLIILEDYAAADSELHFIRL